MYFADGASIRFLDIPGTAMGWLEGPHTFETGNSPSGVRERLLELLSEPAWQPAFACGAHICEIGACADLVDQPQYEIWNGRRVGFGAANLFIPGSNTLYIAPSTIIHYISAHEYRPSDGFCNAVLNCPLMSTQAYFEAFGPALHISPELEKIFSSWVSMEFEAWRELLDRSKPFSKANDRELTRRRIEGFNAVFGANHPL